MGELATAWTRGLQNSSDDPARVQVAVTLKHFVANSIESTIGWSAQVRKTHLLRNSILNTIILSRQARDNHRDDSKREAFSCRRRTATGRDTISALTSATIP